MTDDSARKAVTGKTSMEFPKINFVALLSGVLFLVSTFLYWWGLDFSAFGTAESFRWSLWSGPSTISLNSAQSAQPLTTYSPIVGALVIGAAVLALLGTLPRASQLLFASSVVSIIAPIAYFAVVNDAVTNACNGVSNCISGTFGTETILGATLTWGYQPGFFIEIAGAVVTVISIAFYRTFLRPKTA